MPRNKETNQKIKDERREQIVRAALGLFAKKGLTATRISDISEKTGISQGLIYHYFRSKEELFTWLIKDAIEKMNTAALELEKLPVTAKEKFILAINGLLDGFEKREDTINYYVLIPNAALTESSPEEVKEIIMSNNNIKYDVITRIIMQGQEEGTIKKSDPSDMSLLFFSIINGLALNKSINGSKFKMPDRQIILRMFLNE
jgi:AcrR family transcriptional regulator